MHVAYLDESYNDTYYYVGAAVGSKAAWDEVGTQLRRIRDQAVTDYELAPDAELHAVQIMGGRKEWSNLRGRHREAADILARSLEAARDADIKYVFRGVHMHQLRQRYTMPDHPHSVALEHTLQRLEQHARVLGLQEQVRLVADMIDIRSELQSQFTGYQQAGTRSLWSNKLNHLASSIEFQDSRSNWGTTEHRHRCVPLPAGMRSEGNTPWSGPDAEAPNGHSQNNDRPARNLVPSVDRHITKALALTKASGWQRSVEFGPLWCLVY